jgi:hypothetical protein
LTVSFSLHELVSSLALSIPLLTRKNNGYESCAGTKRNLG